MTLMVLHHSQFFISFSLIIFPTIIIIIYHMPVFTGVTDRTTKSSSEMYRLSHLLLYVLCILHSDMSSDAFVYSICAKTTAYRETSISSMTMLLDDNKFVTEAMQRRIDAGTLTGNYTTVHSFQYM